MHVSRYLGIYPVYVRTVVVSPSGPCLRLPVSVGCSPWEEEKGGRTHKEEEERERGRGGGRERW